MSRSLLILCDCDCDCDCDGDLESNAKRISQILNVQLEKRITPVGESFLFSSMGIAGAIYDLDSLDVCGDEKTAKHRLIIDLGLYATLMGRMYDTIDALYQMTLFIASFITSNLKWPTLICTSDFSIMNELDP